MFGFFRRSKPVAAKDQLGRDGEKAAAEYLVRAGLRILQRNFNCKFGEIDLIARDGETLVFVEVKTRRDESAAAPEESIGPGKQRQLARVARHWLATHGQPDCAYRFDAVSVVWPEGGKPDIRHIVEAFIPRV